ncbi:MAG: DUF5668 domain-containing protein [Candidatus Paceibacterota bacterium]|jgi:hypothetical protein
MRFSIVVLLLGIIFLLRNLGFLMPIANWDIVWPILLIALGLIMMFKKRGCRGCHGMGGACKCKCCQSQGCSSCKDGTCQT